jgi:hypothetical protein
VSQGGFFLGMRAPRLVVIRQDHKPTILQIVLYAAWQAIAATECKRRQIQLVERVNILLAFGPEELIIS